ncbi:twin-arginine translocase subunit TatC [Falsarthrobacter nasiphocae]|uniref:Sec-independent protein translocase protein TatC n=1 Tax=Falsarthrobacter nasiphocae TaxID=189863 RepID=A0AAE3YFK2_9MICC|nr:twin-arginine translocase subunit TatC [Falsarthrobacter nasiphocae]MDR6891101.1 sec-independent protein translocase protein TatC [Falsarthrobacter nasiphocae]
MARARRKDNPEGNMSLGEHLKEARNRFFASAIAIVVCSIAGGFFWKPFVGLLTAPVKEAAGDRGTINFGTQTQAFDQLLQGSLFLGFVASSPFWLYQAWAYLQPALTKKEQRMSLGFLFAAIPLFLGGVYLAWLIYPHAVRALYAFVPEGSTYYLAAAEFIQFVLRLHLAFGFAFLVPLLLVGANMLGFVTGKRVAKAWRIVVFVCVAFAAMAAPGPDLFPMFALAAPMLILFFVAVLVCMVNDRRRARRTIAHATTDEVRPVSAI